MFKFSFIVGSGFFILTIVIVSLEDHVMELVRWAMRLIVVIMIHSDMQGHSLVIVAFMLLQLVVSCTKKSLSRQHIIQLRRISFLFLAFAAVS